MIVATRRRWAQEGRFGAETNARQAAAAAGEAAALVDSMGFVSIVEPDGTRKRLGEVESVRVLRAWREQGAWADFFSLPAQVAAPAGR